MSTGHSYLVIIAIPALSCRFSLPFFWYLCGISPLIPSINFPPIRPRRTPLTTLSHPSSASLSLLPHFLTAAPHFPLTLSFYSSLLFLSPYSLYPSLSRRSEE